MRLTIIVDDSLVAIDGHALRLDLTPYSLTGIHAIQWKDDTGEIEYKDSKPNEPLSNLDDYLPIITAHAAERQRLQDLADSVQPTYREKRALAYIREISPEGTFETAIGDVLDAILKYIKGDPTELNVLEPKIQAIKTRYPAP